MKLPRPWYIRLALAFTRIRVAVDDSDADGWVTETYFKRFRGIIYILRTETYLGLPEHFNCRCILDPEGIQ